MEKKLLIENVKKQFQRMVELRRDIHKHPEIGMETVRTSEIVISEASKFGLKYKKIGNGVVLDFVDEPHIALRADMDALPINEETNLLFSSEIPNRMHACGHDMHTAILLGLIPIVKNMNLPVRMIFQPGEEIGKGAISMIDGGALDGIKFIFGLHAWTSMDVGEYHIVKGGAMAAVDNFIIKIRGKGGHAAYPHLAYDTIAEAARLINYLLEIPSRKVNPLDPAVVSIGYIKGGYTNNVIPQIVEMGGTARSLNQNVASIIEREIKSISNEHVEVTYEKELPVLENDVEYSYSIDRIAKEFVKDRMVPPTMGGEDFAFYCKKTRCAFAFLGTGKINGIEVSKHSSNFNINEESMIYGALLHISAILAAEELIKV